MDWSRLAQKKFIGPYRLWGKSRRRRKRGSHRVHNALAKCRISAEWLASRCL